MKRPLLCLLFLSLLFTKARAQEDFGYKTFDAGASLLWSPDGMSYSLHLASNAKTYHSVIFHIGFDKAASVAGDKHNGEKEADGASEQVTATILQLYPRDFFSALMPLTDR
jgi:hypothetical protein